MRGRKFPIWGNSAANILIIKKESPNEGTEIRRNAGVWLIPHRKNKKRIPEWGDGKNDDGVISMFQYADCIWLLHFFLLTIIKKEESGK